ncbi:MAG: S8/S53 family peptidase [Bacteroidetes bacterium]|nr:S8/S53 family peptidase [Bacteroidota bacterium]
MATLKVNVNKLNVRTSPVKDFDNKENVVGVLQKNAVFESVSLIENELGLWHVNAKGDTISAKFVSAVEGDIPPELMKYHDKIPKIFLDFHLGKLWELPMQEGLKVGIIEQGHVKKHPAIKAGITILKWKEDDQQGQDGTARVLIEEQAEESGAETNHTTTMALIIAGDDPEKGIIGLAPGVEHIYSYSLPENTNPENFIRAFEAMEQKGVNVINISFCASDVNHNTFTIATELIEMISKLKQKGIVVVCATGNFFNAHPPYYPAAYKETISVAGIKNNLTPDVESDFWDGVSISMCSDHYFDKHSFDHSNGTSGATAIMTGCIIRCINSIKTSDKANLLLEKFSKLNTIEFSDEKTKAFIPIFEGIEFLNQLNFIS